MSTRKIFASLAILGLAALPAAATNAQGGSGRPPADQAQAAADFPTWWVGEFPPAPPPGHCWQFSHRDLWGNAYWYLIVR